MPENSKLNWMPHFPLWLFLKTNLKLRSLFQFTVRTLKQGSNTWKKIVQSERVLKPKDSQVFCKRTNEIQGSTLRPLKTLKPFELTWPLRKQPLNLWMSLVRLKKTWESFVFRLTLWLDKLLPSVPVECPHCKACFKRRATVLLSWLDCSSTAARH